jgi:hypothetical protein
METRDWGLAEYVEKAEGAERSQDGKIYRRSSNLVRNAG